MDTTLERKVEELAQEIAGEAKTIQDVNHVLRLMMKSTLERMLDTEMDVHLGRRPAGREDALSQGRKDREAAADGVGNQRPGNRRNGRSSKRCKENWVNSRLRRPAIEKVPSRLR